MKYRHMHTYMLKCRRYIIKERHSNILRIKLTKNYKNIYAIRIVTIVTKITRTTNFFKRKIR